MAVCAAFHIRYIRQVKLSVWYGQFKTKEVAVPGAITCGKIITVLLIQRLRKIFVHLFSHINIIETHFHFISLKYKTA
jgi:hypothetical protein